MLAATLLLCLSLPLNSKKVVLAINCGTSTVSLKAQDSNFQFQPDNKYVSGDSHEADYTLSDSLT